MPVSCNVSAAKARLSDLLRRVQGEEIVLIPDHSGRKRQLGFARGQLQLRPGWDVAVSFEDLFGDADTPAR